MKRLIMHPLSCKGAARQRGISLLVTLVALLVLMITAIALVRSFSASNILAGSAAFKRNSISVGERGFDRAMYLLNTNATCANSFDSSNGACNYSAVMLESDNRGIPKVLLDDSLFTSKGMSAVNDVYSGVGNGNEQIRFVIDRQCKFEGAGDSSHCVEPFSASSSASLGNGSFGSTVLKRKRSAVSQFVVGKWPLRVTVRIQDLVTKEVTYLQSTVVGSGS